MTSLYYLVGAVDAIEWACALCGRHIQNDWVEQQIYIKFCMKLEHSSTETIWMTQKAAAMGNWWLAASLRQCTITHHVSCRVFGKKLCMRHDAWVGTLSWWSCQSPVAQSFGLLNHPNSFHGGMFCLMQNMMQIHCSTYTNHFECDGHTVHMLTQWHLPSPLTSTVKVSLFTQVHPSLLSLATRLHQCCTSFSHYVNNGWSFSGYTLYIHPTITK